MSSQFSIFSQNGQIYSMEDAVISLTSIEYAYGFGVYENIRVSKGEAKYADEHSERLMKSAEILGLEHLWGREEVEKWVEELVEEVKSEERKVKSEERNAKCETFNLKILLIGGRTADDASLNILPLAPKFPDKKWYKTGVDVITSEYERLYPQAKTLNMLGSYLAYKKARDAGAYDALLISRDGYLLEGTRTNLFAIKGKELITAPDERVLPGVTRKHVIESALKNNFSIKYECFGIVDLREFDGLFLTSTSSKVLPIKKIGQREIGNISEEMKKLMKDFEDYQHA